MALLRAFIRTARMAQEHLAPRRRTARRRRGTARRARRAARPRPGRRGPRRVRARGRSCSPPPGRPPSGRTATGTRRRLAAFARSRDEWLDDWRAAAPHDPDALLVKAELAVYRGWESPARAELLREVGPLITAAAEGDPRDPVPWRIALDHARGTNAGHAEFEQLWGEAVRRSPHHYGCHVAALQYLSRRLVRLAPRVLRLRRAGRAGRAARLPRAGPAGARGLRVSDRGRRRGGAARAPRRGGRPRDRRLRDVRGRPTPGPRRSATSWRTS